MRLRFIAIFLYFPFTVMGQDISISGEILDVELNKLAGASVILTSRENHSQIAGGFSDADGKFKFSVNKRDTVVLQVSSLSYKTVSIPLQAVADTILTVYLEPDVIAMSTITVVGRRKTIHLMDDGNISVALENIPGYDTENVSSIIRKLPGVSVSGVGPTLYGQSATIYVNGNKLEGINPSEYLESLPASSLKDVELIANLGANYDASSAAVINLVTIRMRENGHRTSVRAGGSVDRYGEFGAEGNLFTMIKRNNLYFNNSLSYSNSPERRQSQDTTFYTNTNRERIQFGFLKRTTNRWTNNANVSLDMKHDQRLSANVFLFYNRGDDSSSDSQVLTGGVRQQYHSRANLERYMVSGNIGYKSGTNLPFTLAASYGIVWGKMDRDEEQNVTQNDQPHLSFNLATNEKAIQHTANVDYLQYFFDEKVLVRAGVKGDLGSLDGGSIYHLHKGDHGISNTLFDGNELISAIYLTLRYKLSNDFSFDAGLRSEYTDININNRSLQIEASNNYWNTIPSVLLNYKPSNKYSGSLVLVGGLTRPNYEFLMPGVTYLDDFSYQTGNPNLIPRQYYSIGFRNMFFEVAYLNVLGVFTKNRIHRVAIMRPGEITEYTYMNCVDSKALDIYLGLPFRLLGNKIYGQLNFRTQVGKYTNPSNGFSMLPDRENFHETSTSLFIDYTILPRLSVEGYLDYKLKSKTLQYDNDGFAVLDLGMRYYMDKNKNLALSLSVSDLFNSRKNHTTYYYDNIVSRRESFGNSQLFRIGLSYQFRGGKSFTRDAAYDPNDTSRFE